MYKAIYRAYRPETFEEVLGQEYIVKVLQNQVAQDQVSHAYLFCGTRGTGKTTIARLLAKAVNCTGNEPRPCGQCENCRAIAEGTFMDLVEIDAASNNGVENIRELRESVNYPPVAGRKKVYIMDEVHMLSGSAFNALLKTLEEPPENVMFILCTTEPEKLPPTVLSRCMRMDFRRVSEGELLTRMQQICQDKGVIAEEGGLALIAGLADGSVRDGLSLLEQCISGRTGIVTRQDILEAIGAVGEETFLDLTEMVRQGQVAQGLLQIDAMLQSGKDARQIIQGWMSHYRNLLLVRYIENPENVVSMSTENIARLQRQSDSLELGDITGAIRELSRILFDAKRSSQPRILLEMAMVKLASGDASEEVIQPVRPIKAVAPAAPVQQVPADQEPLGQVEVEPAPMPEPEPVPTPPITPTVADPGPLGKAPVRPGVDPLNNPMQEAAAALQQDKVMSQRPDFKLPEGPTGRQEPEAAPVQEAFPVQEPAPALVQEFDFSDPGEQMGISQETFGQSAPAPEAQAPQATPEAPAPAPEPQVDPAALWEAFLTNGEKTIGNMFFSLRDSAYLDNIDGNVVTVAVTGGARAYMTDNMDRMVKLMEAVWGKPCRIALIQAKPAQTQEPAEQADDRTEELRALAESVLGVDVKLQ